MRWVSEVLSSWKLPMFTSFEVVRPIYPIQLILSVLHLDSIRSSPGDLTQFAAAECLTCFGFCLSSLFLILILCFYMGGRKKKNSQSIHKIIGSKKKNNFLWNRHNWLQAQWRRAEPLWPTEPQDVQSQPLAERHQTGHGPSTRSSVCPRYLSGKSNLEGTSGNARKKVGLLSPHPAACHWRSLFERRPRFSGLSGNIRTFPGYSVTSPRQRQTVAAGSSG